jgi:hypothetical protein
MAQPKEWAITFAVAVLFSTFVIVSVDSFYEEPRYEDFCQNPNYPKFVSPSCRYGEDPRVTQCYDSMGTPTFTYNESGCEVFSGCTTCNKDFENAQKNYTRNLFLIIAPLGLIAVVAGVLYYIEFIGTGFMFSGVFLMFYATVRYFEDMHKYLRPIVLFIELSVILWIAFKKLVVRKK